MSTPQEFRDYREKMNERILSNDNKMLKRFFSLDNQCYQKGALTEKTKEMLGLIASLVLRCDDCIKYHVEQSYEKGLNEAEFFEILAIGNLVGGSICIPHSRRAVEFWDALKEQEKYTK